MFEFQELFSLSLNAKSHLFVNVIIFIKLCFNVCSTTRFAFRHLPSSTHANKVAQKRVARK